MTKDWRSQHSDAHIQERKEKRAVTTAHDAVDRAVAKMKRLCKARKVPNGHWNLPVRFNGQIIGYVVGQGVTIRSFFNASMVVRGEEIK